MDSKNIFHQLCIDKKYYSIWLVIHRKSRKLFSLWYSQWFDLFCVNNQRALPHLTLAGLKWNTKNRSVGKQITYIGLARQTWGPHEIYFHLKMNYTKAFTASDVLQKCRILWKLKRYWKNGVNYNKIHLVFFYLKFKINYFSSALTSSMATASKVSYNINTWVWICIKAFNTSYSNNKQYKIYYLFKKQNKGLSFELVCLNT